MTKVKRISDIITPKFRSFWAAANSHKYLRYVLKGGRGSSKSTHIGIRLIKDMMQYPVSTLVVRKVGNTLGESVFEQLKEAIDLLGVGSYWRVNKSPLKLTYIPRGNSIIFKGADDPAKIKSLKIAKYPVAFLWIEELAEFKLEEEVSMIENSVLRAELPDGLFYAFYYSYNPPKRKQSWVNKKYESAFVPKNTYIHHSTYLENPYISKAFKEEAETVKERNLLKYKWEYLGEAIGSGVVPFNNLQFRKITDQEVKSFDNIRQGNDFGYGPDPLAFVRWHYDKKKKTIYALDELYAHKLSNRMLAKWIKDKGYDRHEIITDSAEPKSIDELKSEHGIRRIRGAKKGPDSRQYGEEWLDDLDAIVIDPERTPNIAREFENADYKTDKDGNPLPKLEEKDDHTIDATRYAFERDMKQSGVSIFK
ncbi:PBSX family phage terminase large subunit [Bacillus licheniformis]|uniref:PBSX family phage terminase large subunit n=1 Tax=Bacillus licheniformis TaxID=1402 RepID=UPI0011A49576|nr:PBSX family phage terminase large subunit [Bacillus licheniformis]